jgi:hypothetical protein
MKKFWELFATSVITQSIITIMVIGVWCYMMVAQIPIPPFLTDIVALVVGFFFGSKYAMAMNGAYMSGVHATNAVGGGTNAPKVQ